MRLDEVLTLERPLVGVDLETTGVSTRESEICELALEIMKPGEAPREYRTLVRPILPIPAGATAVHGITYQMTQACRVCSEPEEAHPSATCASFVAWPTFRQLAENLLNGLQNADLAGYNLLSFDVPILMSEFERAGFTWDPEGSHVIDGYRIWQLLEGRTLSHAVERWLRPSTRQSVIDEAVTADLGDGAAHNALWDIKMSTRVIASQVIQATLPRTPSDLHAYQWADRYDLLGKIRRDRDGTLVFGFGEHNKKPLTAAPRGYLQWIIRSNFSERVKDACRASLK